MKLKDYFQKLRTEHRAFPILEDDEIKRMTLKQLTRVCKERHCLPKNWQTAERPAFVKALMQQQARQRPVSYNLLAERCGYDPTAVRKIGVGLPVRISTLRRVLTVGLGLSEKSEEYNHAIALWTQEFGGTVMDGPEYDAYLTARRRRQQSSFDDFMARIMPKLARLPESRREDVIAVLEVPAILDAIPALRKLYAGESRS